MKNAFDAIDHISQKLFVAQEVFSWGLRNASKLERRGTLVTGIIAPFMTAAGAASGSEALLWGAFVPAAACVTGAVRAARRGMKYGLEDGQYISFDETRFAYDQGKIDKETYQAVLEYEQKSSEAQDPRP